jgi:transposase
MERTRKNYSLDFKVKAVELSHLKESVKIVAEQLSIPEDNLRRWRKEAKNGKLSLESKPIKVRSKEEIENIALRKALKDAELERDILKKALSIFSKSDR